MQAKVKKGSETRVVPRRLQLQSVWGRIVYPRAGLDNRDRGVWDRVIQSKNNPFRKCLLYIALFSVLRGKGK